jgi:hypothetical protein
MRYDRTYVLAVASILSAALAKARSAFAAAALGGPSGIGTLLD